ncbi:MULTISPECIES: radical SAM protein [Actinomycetes]|uniref:radical SAM protein n=1 Tax=Actinomycetes TaxID=1760 RepID=UPI0026486664|nr:MULTISPECIES: radical SAM protein [Actinomycetes]MDN5973561.1 radical SAM protein [Bifidobacterium crudilactis]MDN6458095.1 radical SAM protein [Yaniella sp.]MDN6468325.1 radical SAM protein [Bifidobacterium crudilactis]MDN6523499.1 radical SAM protein [Bifidobacterium crudilactis]MDN6559653.1 radical SAM protein [Bifidobacterium crudilactis]
MVETIGPVYISSNKRTDGSRLALNVKNGACAYIGETLVKAIKAGTLEPGSRESRFFSDEDTVSAQAAVIPQLSLELTTACNLRCPYCYQLAWSSSKTVSDETVEAFAEAALEISEKEDVSGIDIELIGGEPMIAASKIVNLARLLRSHNVNWRAILSTNGMFDMRRVFSEIDALTCVVCLTLPEDNMRMRYMKGTDTSAKIVENISQLKTHRGQRVSLRYNVHRRNAENFAEYLDWIESCELDAVDGICTARIDTKHNPQCGVEPLSNEEYDAWQQQVALPALIDHGWPPPVSLLGVRGPCRAHAPYSFKVLYDGTVVPCVFFCADERTSGNAIPRHNINMREVAQDVNRIQSVFPNVKKNPKESMQCQQCEFRYT